MTLSIIIVNWNSGVLLRRCLDSLEAAVYRNAPLDFEVFVVDNASFDDSLVRAKQSAQPFHLVALNENVGFARANNIALQRAQGEVLLLLNPDTEPRPGSLRQLVEFFATHPKAGVVGGKLFNADGSVQRSVRRLPTPRVLALLLTRLAWLFPTLAPWREYEMANFSYDQPERVEQVMGACFAIRREALRSLGLLDERYWVWFEETDYCARALRAGFEIWFTPSVQVVHHLAAAFRQVTAFRRALWFSKSALKYAAKHFGPGWTMLLTFLLPVNLLTAIPATLLGTPPSVTRPAGTRR